MSQWAKIGEQIQAENLVRRTGSCKRDSAHILIRKLPSSVPSAFEAKYCPGASCKLGRVGMYLRYRSNLFAAGSTIQDTLALLARLWPRYSLNLNAHLTFVSHEVTWWADLAAGISLLKHLQHSQLHFVLPTSDCPLFPPSPHEIRV